ncbi:transposase [methane-oxidizing endosymbiont of Gigantopelta aegis]|uniref:transposase n=1 Tax=methane-oxidizing endosymbiont of Gigantopelta aegis TaxID=2794938 RepID=UPI001FDA01FD|nr:transposase [methane-oxidizing endosymbiont of Gigantopelta aegis]
MLRFTPAKTRSLLGIAERGRHGILLFAPYSPELNRIEMLWRKIKYEWLPFKQMEPEELENEIDKIHKGFSSEYNLTFC